MKAAQPIKSIILKDSLSRDFQDPGSYSEGKIAG